MAPTGLRVLGLTRLLVAALKKLVSPEWRSRSARTRSANPCEDVSEVEPGFFLSITCPAGVVRALPPELREASPRPPRSRPLPHLHDRVIEGAVVFIGPCIARKDESDRSVKTIDAALTFRELRRWLHDESVAPEKCVPGPEDHFFPEPTGDGFLYPVEGGMCDMIRANGVDKKVRFVTVSGLQNLRRYLRALSRRAGRAVFGVLRLSWRVHQRTWRHVGRAGLLRRNRVEAYANLSNAPRHTIFLEDEGPRCGRKT